MATRNLVSAVRQTLDGNQRQFRFESEDGEPIPHGLDDIVVKINGDPLEFRRDYSMMDSAGTTVIILLKRFERGNELSIERHTRMDQPEQFRRSKGFTVDAMERGLDHLTRATQDALRRITDVERIVSVEHRVVEMPADAQTVPDAALVYALEQHLGNAGMTVEDKAQLAETIALVVVSEFQQLTDGLARRLAVLEDQMTGIAHATDEDIAA